MANILVVGKFPEPALIKYANGYKGVHRSYINYPFEYYGREHEIVELYREYEDLTEEDGFLHDLGFAKKLRNIYQKAYPEKEWEIIEIAYGGDKVEGERRFLGYDIEDRGDSNILKIILPFSIPEAPANDRFGLTFSLLSQELKCYLNEYELFSDFRYANLALSLIQDVFELFGRAKPHHKYSVAGVYLVEYTR